MYFVSPSKGHMSFENMMTDIVDYIRDLPTSAYKVIIGSDSQVVQGETHFITAVIVHRLGKGARYFYRKRSHRKIKSLRQKIFFETSLSLEIGSLVTKVLHDAGLDELKMEIHIDVGNHGDTRDLIREVVGMVVGSGFKAKIKPDAYGASSVADKHTK
ncbi:MAG: ribonuclease H-like YkuK family protein [Bacillota bacterium]